MNLKRKIEVVMLPTNEKARENDYGLLLGISGELYLPQAYTSSFKPQHLYFLSDEKVKESDWCILNLGENTRLVRVKSLNSGHPVFTVDVEEGYAQLSNLKKVIATTDKVINLPEPSPQFIQKFIEEWNRGNKIIEVMVDFTYEPQSYENLDLLVKGNIYPQFLKVDKNNYITITKVKNSWSREELRPKFLKLCHDVADYIEKDHEEATEFNIDEWIEENL